MNLISIIKNLEESNDLPMSRILIILRIFCGRKGVKKFKGLTKLAKLDFLVRYPKYLEQALKVLGIDPAKAKVKDYEKNSIESKMIRFHYGPWDPRHREIINLLIGKGLVEAVTEPSTSLWLTAKGVQLADKISKHERFQNLVERSRLLKRYFDYSGKRLKDFIYETFPQISSLRIGEKISYEY